MTTTVITSFSRMRDDEIAIRAHNIVEKMTGNPNFTTPVPALADITAALTEYHLALEQAQNGGTDKTAAKNAKRLALEGLLRSLALYVQLQCKNDLAIILGSGFDARKAPATPVTVMKRPAEFTVVNGPYPGSMELSVERIPGAGSYVFEYAAWPVTETTPWEKISVRSRTYTIKGLTSGQQYAFRATAVGFDDTPVYSDVISRYAPY